MSRIRRDHIVEDGLATFNSLSESQLRDALRIEFVDVHGNPEPGIDGGGLFKEFLLQLTRVLFNPEMGLFRETDTHELVPAVTAFKTHHNAPVLFNLVGKVHQKSDNHFSLYSDINHKS